jgi:hypothetical protein
LGLASPWKVVTSDFNPVARTLQFVIDFGQEDRFTDPVV